MKTQTESFGEVNFSQAQPGDARRTRRLVKTVELMCRRPGGTLPQKLNAPKDLRAFYRLMNCDKVTHEAILSAHRDVVLTKIAQTKSTVLLLSDATEMDYSTHESLREPGQTGNGNHRGYIVQNSLAVDANTRKATEILCEDYVLVLSAWRHGTFKREWSIHDFFYALARLGGHQNRKNDHPPGWQTIWKGWQELQAMLCGADAVTTMDRCG